MDPERWRKLQDLFTEARAVHGEARERLLHAHAASDAELVEQVRSLLVADARPGLMDDLAPRLASVSRVLEPAAPRRIGPYRIIRELGRGGMGAVYLAERADGQFRQEVAIKLLGTADANDPLHRRFLAERQILAGLVHPNIARLLDGGLTEDGRPYIVLEYVDGLPITSWCDQQHLDIRARLGLFADVCAAVQHAHQNLVIHRDLKPSNILVSRDGRVHLLDFGIAKLIDPALTAAQAPMTRHEHRVMTPEYASPEQVRGEPLTTASDIYSLGVLLHVLLTGLSPYRLTSGSLAEVAATVVGQDPARPSERARRAELDAGVRGTTNDRLARQLEGDLDGIVLMAMRKEPGRRYASADVLRQDIERHLGGLPVIAHRGSRAYRVGKLLRRHRIEAVAGVIVLSGLVVGLSIAVAQSRRAGVERDRAEQALAQSDGVTNFLMELFRTGDADDPVPSDISAADLLERGVRRANALSAQPSVQARLLDVVGQMSLHIGRLDDAQRLLEQAVGLRRQAGGDGLLDLASSLIHLSWVHRSRGDHDSARPLVAEALTIRQRALPPTHPDIGTALYELGWLTGGTPQERLYRQALDILPDTGTLAERRVTVLQALSTNLRRQGRLADAVAADRDALRTAQTAFGPDHDATGYAMIHLADHVRDIEQDLVAAEHLYRRGLERIVRRHGEHSVRLLHGLHSLGTLLSWRGDHEAERVFRRAIAIRRSATGPEHPQVAEGLQLLAGELSRQGRLMEAEALQRQALAHSQRTLGPRHPVVTNERLPHLAAILDAQGRRQEADELYETALEQSTSGSVMLGQIRRDYGRLLLRRGEHERAERELLRSLMLLEQVYGGPDHPNVQETKRALMELYLQWGRPALVERYRVPPGRYVPY